MRITDPPSEYGFFGVGSAASTYAAEPTSTDKSPTTEELLKLMRDARLMFPSPVDQFVAVAMSRRMWEKIRDGFEEAPWRPPAVTPFTLTIHMWFNERERDQLRCELLVRYAGKGQVLWVEDEGEETSTDIDNCRRFVPEGT